jgi:hypothetical protein
MAGVNKVQAKKGSRMRNSVQLKIELGGDQVELESE